MAREYARTQRVAEQIRRELAELIRTALKDPRLGRVTVTEVEVSRDLAHARVYVTLPPDEAEQSLKGLTSAAGFLRRALAERMSMRTVPALRFIHDTTLDRADALSALIDQALGGDRYKGSA